MFFHFLLGAPYSLISVVSVLVFIFIECFIERANTCSAGIQDALYVHCISLVAGAGFVDGKSIVE